MKPPPLLDDPIAFIRTETVVLPVPHAPEIRLHLAADSSALWQKTEDELATIGLPPPYWAFAWAGGQALARHILDHPEIVRGKRVLDFASGSGIVAIAAMLAGATSAVASEIDAIGRVAIGLNAALNAVVFEITGEDVLATPPAAWDVVVAGDVCYERPMADAALAWLRTAAANGATVLLGDPGRAYLPKAELVALATYAVATSRDLEDAEVKRTSVWRFA